MRSLFVSLTDFPNAALPDALLASDFPPLLADIEIVGSNINRLPDDLHLRWPPGLIFFFKFNPLPAFPSVLETMKVAVLSLVGCGLTMVPREALLMPETFIFALSLNPRQSPPDTRVDPRAVATSFLFLDSTNMTSLPPWMDEIFLLEETLFLSRSPHCREQSISDHVTERLNLIHSRPSLTVSERCFDAFSTQEGFYPLYLEVREEAQW